MAYDAFILYMNEITSLLRGIGYKSIRMWNDDVYRITDTGWCGAAKLDQSIDVQYWCPLTNNGANSAKFYLDKRHNIYNFTRLYTYYTLYPEECPSRTTPKVILNEWNPYLFAPNNSESTTDNTFTFPPFNPENYIKKRNDGIKGHPAKSAEYCYFYFIHDHRSFRLMGMSLLYMLFSQKSMDKYI